jgi:hypothetical protein
MKFEVLSMLEGKLERERERERERESNCMHVYRWIKKYNTHATIKMRKKTKEICTHISVEV